MSLVHRGLLGLNGVCWSGVRTALPHPSSILSHKSAAPLSLSSPTKLGEPGGRSQIEVGEKREAEGGHEGTVAERRAQSLHQEGCSEGPCLSPTSRTSPTTHVIHLCLHSIQPHPWHKATTWPPHLASDSPGRGPHPQLRCLLELTILSPDCIFISPLLWGRGSPPVLSWRLSLPRPTPTPPE